jgi:hypothetical protein
MAMNTLHTSRESVNPQFPAYGPARAWAHGELDARPYAPTSGPPGSEIATVEAATRILAAHDPLARDLMARGKWDVRDCGGGD